MISVVSWLSATRNFPHYDVSLQRGVNHPTCRKNIPSRRGAVQRATSGGAVTLEKEGLSTLQERVKRIERKLEGLAQRVERIEQRATSSPQPRPQTPPEAVAAQPVIPPPPVSPPLSEKATTRLAPSAEKASPSEPALQSFRLRQNLILVSAAIGSR